MLKRLEKYLSVDSNIVVPESYDFFYDWLKYWWINLSRNNEVFHRMRPSVYFSGKCGKEGRKKPFQSLKKLKGNSYSKHKPWKKKNTKSVLMEFQRDAIWDLEIMSLILTTSAILLSMSWHFFSIFCLYQLKWRRFFLFINFDSSHAPL